MSSDRKSPCCRGAYHPGRRRGLTLIELLVVVTILLIVVSSALALLPNPEERRLREAAREVNSYFAMARGQAMAIGRPVGVEIQRLAANQQAAMVLSMVEVPPPYAGDTPSSRMQVTVNGLAQFTTSDTGWIGLVRLGDLVKLDYQGGLSEIRVGDASVGGFLVGQPWLLVPYSGPQRSTTPSGSAFQIYRQPVKSAIAPLQLSESAVIDLSASGLSDNEFYAADGSPVTILFQPDGSVGRVFYLGSSLRPVTKIHLLIGKSDQVPPIAIDVVHSNWHDAECFWVAVQPDTGQITTCENASVDPTITDPGQGLSIARQLVDAGQSIGGR
jgi:prepilin-type N-terminal cleavage/methylation domain-containing protein